MSIQQQIMAALTGVAVFVLLVVFGEVALRLASHQITQWLSAGIPLTGWRQIFASVTDFFSRYFAVMSPLVLLACVSAAVAWARARSRRAA